MTAEQLRDRAKTLGLTGYSNATKAELEEMIAAAEVDPEEPKKADVVVLVKFTSPYKNLVVAGTNIAFKDGFYETDKADEIAVLERNNLVNKGKAGE